MSEFRSEDQELSSEAEMQMLVHEAADFTSPSDNWKDRVQAAARAFGFSWPRTKSFYYQDARRVESKEMDHARAVVRELKAKSARRKAAEHIQWLYSIGERAVESGANLDRADLAAVQRVLAQVGAFDSTLGDPGSTDAENEDQSIGWGR